jgi:hypothetical protein
MAKSKYLLNGNNQMPSVRGNNDPSSDLPPSL